MKLAALSLVGLGLVSVAQAQVQTNPVPAQQYLPVPDLLPGLPFDTGLSAIDPVMFSDSMRGSVQDVPAPAAVVEEVNTASVPTSAADAGQVELAPPQPIAPQTVAVQDPTAVIPEPATEPKPAEVEEKPEEKPKPARKNVINVIVEGVESSSGTVNVAVCNTALSKEGCPFHTEVKASAGFVEAQFEGIPPGRYAVVGYHDVNGNSEHDKNFLGVPKEPYALSSKAGGKMIPTFNDAAVNIKKGENTVIITMRRFGS